VVPPSYVFFFIAIVSIDISTINHSEIGVICTNLANELGQHLACMKKTHINSIKQYWLWIRIVSWIHG
jgi:hypothetical protein